MKTYKVELTEEFIKQAHTVACREWKTKIEETIPEAFPAKLTGNWYRIDDVIFYTTEIGHNGSHYGYRIQNGIWTDHRKGITGYYCACNSVAFQRRARRATEDEVESALKDVAKKMGLVKGATVKCAYDNSDENIIEEIYYDKGSLWANTKSGYNFGLYSDSRCEWAKVVKKPLETNKWYRHINHDCIVLRTGQRNNIGFMNGKWETDIFCEQEKEWKPVTDREVKWYLVKEAKRKGFKNVDLLKIKTPDGSTYSAGYFLKGSNTFTYWNNRLSLDGVQIFDSGKWAEILENEVESKIKDIQKELEDLQVESDNKVRELIELKGKL